MDRLESFRKSAGSTNVMDAYMSLDAQSPSAQVQAIARRDPEDDGPLGLSAQKREELKLRYARHNAPFPATGPASSSYVRTRAVGLPLDPSSSSRRSATNSTSEYEDAHVGPTTGTAGSGSGVTYHHDEEDPDAGVVYQHDVILEEDESQEQQ